MMNGIPAAIFALFFVPSAENKELFGSLPSQRLCGENMFFQKIHKLCPMRI